MTPPRAIRRPADLVRALDFVPPFTKARPELEQVATPVEAAADLLRTAQSLDDLSGRTVLDLGAGTGRLAIGAALLGAASVTAVELDSAAIELGRTAAASLGVDVRWEEGEVGRSRSAADTVVMNPPFGAQRKRADRPFWDAAFAAAGRAIYAFSLSDSRTFIAGLAVERSAYVEATRPVRWELPRVFPHHRRDRVSLAVDLWVIRPKGYR
jgi:putative methylase